MVAEMIKKGVGQGCIFHVIIPSHYIFLVKILLVKLKHLYTSACLKLNYCAKQKPKM